MPIDFDCPNCGRSYRVRDSFAGKQVNCKDCETALQVPGGVDEIEEYFEDAADEFSSLLSEAVGESRSASSLPPRTGSASRAGKRVKSKSAAGRSFLKQDGGPVLSWVLKIIGIVISSFGYLAMVSIARYNGPAFFVLLFLALVSLAVIRGNYEGDDRWVLGPASFIIGHSIVTFLAMLLVGDPWMLIDVAILGGCGLLMLNLPGVITTVLPMGYYCFTFVVMSNLRMRQGLDIQVTAAQKGVAMALSVSMVVVLLGALFLCFGAKARRWSS